MSKRKASSRQVPAAGKKRKVGAAAASVPVDSGAKDDFFIESESDDEDALKGPDVEAEAEEDPYGHETADERRIRLRKQYLKSLEEKKAELSDDEVEDPIAHRLLKDVLEQKGRLQSLWAAKLKDVTLDGSAVRIMKGHKYAATCVALTDDESTAYTGGKDCCIIKWDVETGKKYHYFGGRTFDSKQGSTGHVLSVAVSWDGNLLASGGTDKMVRIWDTRANRMTHCFNKHRDVVSSIAFRDRSHSLYSASYDRTVIVWDLDQFAYVESLFGHQAEITCIDSLLKERALTCGADKTLRLWKIPEESQLMFKSPGITSSIDACAMVNDEFFLTGQQEGSIALWTSTKRKPCQTIHNAHGAGNWIASVAAQPFSDVVATGSSDGFVRIWHCDTEAQRLSALHAVPVTGFVNGLRFSKSGRFLAAAVGQEPRLGRWGRIQPARNGLQIIKLGEASNLRTVPVGTSGNFLSSGSTSALPKRAAVSKKG